MIGNLIGDAMIEFNERVSKPFVEEMSQQFIMLGEEVQRGVVIRKVRQAIYETYRDRNPTLETAETGPRWSLEPEYRQDDFTAMAIAAVDALDLQPDD